MGPIWTILVTIYRIGALVMFAKVTLASLKAIIALRGVRIGKEGRADLLQTIALSYLVAFFWPVYLMAKIAGIDIIAEVKKDIRKEVNSK